MDAVGSTEVPSGMREIKVIQGRSFLPPRSPERGGACWLQRSWVTLAHLLCFTSPSMQYLSPASAWDLSGVGTGPQSALA